MWQPWVCATAASHLCLQYVHHFELRHYAYLLCPPSSCIYNSHINKNDSFLALFMRIFNSCVG